jgi:signal transduction histidine kinase
MESLYLSFNNEAAQDFAAVRVHKIRNPLTSIRLSVAMITASAKHDDIQKYLDIISRSSDKIGEMVEESPKRSDEVRNFKIKYN